MNAAARERLFGFVMLWTVVTSIFAWLPLVRIIGRPEGYQWQIGSLSGSGTSGPFWIFILLTTYVVVMLFGAFRLPRAVFHPMLMLWHLAVTGVVVAGVVAEGAGATWEGQGLRFSFALWAVGVVCVAFTALAALWILVDRRAGGGPTSVKWAAANSARVAASLLLLAVAVALFRAGTNYNWVTAAAIVATVIHWILLVQAFAPAAREDLTPAAARQAGPRAGRS